MPRTKLTAEEEVQNLNRRATESLLLARRKKIELAMRNCPRCIDALWEKLQSLGFSDEVIKTKEESQTKSLQAQALEIRRAKRRDLKDSLAAPVCAENEDDSADGPAKLPREWLPEKVKTVSDLTVVQLRDKLLPMAEPKALSGPNLRAMKESGVAGSTSKQNYLKIYEFVTGEQPELQTLKGRLRCLRRLGLYARARSQARGHRGLSLPLPPTWETDGVFQVVGYGGEGGKGVVVQNRFTKVAATIPEEQVPTHSSLEELILEFNWSDMKACLMSTGDASGERKVRLCSFFPVDRVKIDADDDEDGEGAALSMVSPGKRPRLAAGGHEFSTPPLKIKVEPFASPRTPYESKSSSSGAAPAGVADVGMKQAEQISAAAGGEQGAAACAEAPPADSPADYDESRMAPPPPPPAVRAEGTCET